GGISISAGVLRPDEDANRDVYGPGASPRTILASREISAPPEARELLYALASVSNVTPAAGPDAPTPSAGDKHSTASRTGEPPAPSGEPAQQAASNRNMRARVAEVQQTLDRLLTSTGNS